MLASSVTDLSWVEQVSSQGRPVFIIAEGLLMYLHERDVCALVLCLHPPIPGCVFEFDVFGKLTTDRIKAQPSLQKAHRLLYYNL